MGRTLARPAHLTREPRPILPDRLTTGSRIRRPGPATRNSRLETRVHIGVALIMAQVQTEAKPIVTRNQALGWLRQMMLIRRFEERAEMLYQKPEDRRLLPPVQRPGAGGRRLDRRPPRGRLRHHRLPRPRPRPGPGHGRQGRRWPSCSARPPAAPRARAARCTSSTPRRASSAATRSSAATSRWPPGVAFAIKYRGEDRVCICYFGDGAINQGSLHEALQHGRALEAAGHLRRREQPVCDGDLSSHRTPRPCST